VANGSPLTVISSATESDGQSSELMKVWKPVALATEVVVLSGARLKLRELKTATWSSWGRS
jgi:hypothetical protein